MQLADIETLVGDHPYTAYTPTLKFYEEYAKIVNPFLDIIIKETGHTPTSDEVIEAGVALYHLCLAYAIGRNKNEVRATVQPIPDQIYDKAKWNILKDENRKSLYNLMFGEDKVDDARLDCLRANKTFSALRVDGAREDLLRKYIGLLFPKQGK